jgi:NADH-quinone oxidoreductase subunit J
MRSMEQVAFFAGAIGALGGAVAVIALRNPFYSVLALVVHLFALAGLFLLLHAEFVAAAQVVVYAGAVMVLYVFVAAYVGGFEEPLWDAIPGQRVLAPLLAGALFIELSIAILGTSLKSLSSQGPTIPLGFGSPEAIGRLLLERFLIPFEAASLLLLIAAVGAVVLAARRPALEASERPDHGEDLFPLNQNGSDTNGAGTPEAGRSVITAARDAD